MKLKLIATLLLSASLSVFANVKNDKIVDGLLIRKCSSGVNYPTKGDEKVQITHKELTYHAKILHPKCVKGPHISCPLFWVTGKEPNRDLIDVVTTKNHIGLLSWLSANGYFFAQSKGEKSGFFFEDGFDNADNGSSGIIFIFDGKDATLYRWIYIRDPEKEKGKYEISLADDGSKKMSKKLMSDIAPMLKYAESEAKSWPGP